MGFPNTSMLTSWGPGQGIDRDIEFFDDFGQGYKRGATFGNWVETLGTSVTPLVGANGLIMLSAGGDNDSIQIQAGSVGTASGRFTTAVDRDIYCAMRLKTSDANALDWIAGIGTVDSTALAATTDFIGFGPATGSTPVNASSANLFAIHGDDIGTWAAGDMTDTGFDLVDDQFVDLAFWVQSRDRVRFYVNGKERTVSTVLPDAGALLTPTVAIVDNGGAATILTLEYIYVTQKRGIAI